MRYKQLTQFTGVILSLFLLALVANPALAATYDLCTGVTTKTIGTELITLWGFGLDPGSGDCPASVPGPVLTVPADDPTLTIHLRNTLPEPTSLHILGQQFSAAPTPTFSADGRVMSFTHEAAPTASYTWGTAVNPFKPGTYMVQSGTNPAKQVQMGLYAAVKKDEGANLAYTGVPYDKELIVVFHEIDPDIHAAIRDNMYGPAPTDPPPAGWITSSAFRHPRYFLINGMVHPEGGLDPINAGITWNEGERVLLRFVNAGLETHVPQILGMYMTSVAEDGNPYEYGREEYGFELAAAKTKDAIIQPAQGRYPLYDARLNMTNMGDWPGGMLAYLLVGGAAPGVPTANPDSATVAEGGTVTVLDTLATSVLANDTDGIGPLTAALATGPTHASAFTLNTDGTFSYTHDGSETTSDGFTYTASDGTNVSAPATVAIAVTPVNDVPVANDDADTAVQGTTITIDVLANDTDAENDPITVTNLDTTSTSGSAVINLDNTVNYTAPIAPFTGPDTFTYTANDGTDDSNVATVTVEVTAPAANQPPVAVDDNATVVRNSSGNLINVVANDFDPDGSIDTGSVFIVDPPSNGTAVEGANGVVIYTPNPRFHKQDSFSYRVLDNEGALSQRDTPTGLSDEPTVVFVNVVRKLN